MTTNSKQKHWLAYSEDGTLLLVVEAADITEAQRKLELYDDRTEGHSISFEQTYLIR